MAQALIPVASAALFCGLLGLTITQLRSDGIVLPGVDLMRAGLVCASTLWSAILSYRVTGIYSRSTARRVWATVTCSVPLVFFSAAWVAWTV